MSDNNENAIQWREVTLSQWNNAPKGAPVRFHRIDGVFTYEIGTPALPTDRPFVADVRIKTVAGETTRVVAQVDRDALRFMPKVAGWHSWPPDDVVITYVREVDLS